MILTSDLIATLTLGLETLIMCVTHLLIMLYLSVQFYQICLSSLRATQFWAQFDPDLIVTLTLGVGTQLLCAVHLLIMFYLSVKFR